MIKKQSKYPQNWPLTLAALGVVFGDIGTSPLYALPAALHGLIINRDNVLGILSLIFWVLILVISTRYMSVFLNADNQGEGGVLALLALIKRKKTKFYPVLFILGVLGAGLLIGDGMLTPAISVLSAIEGLKIITPNFSHFIVPITFIILIILFFCQRYGTGRIGYSFGPILLMWFLIIAVLGIYRILENKVVLFAINPYYAIHFFYLNGWAAYRLLGGVFLVITGAEALYADLGHFGKNPIRYGWFLVALPALILNYFGQGAYLLESSSAIENPFYRMAPDWFEFPLLIMATLATIIASQAVISASFSLVRQAILLNLAPKFNIVQTSASEYGQIYVPQINFFLAVGTLFLVIFFETSAALAGAYGMAVNLVMIIVGIFVMTVAHQQWKWSLLRIFWVFWIFMLIDLAFLGANAHKILEGGWIPLIFAFFCLVMMLTWQKGIQLLHSAQDLHEINGNQISKEFNSQKFQYLSPASVVFITDSYDKGGGVFLRYLRKVNILPDHVIIVGIRIERTPKILRKHCFEVTQIADNVYHLVLRFGFMQTIDIPNTLKAGVEKNYLPFQLDMEKILYFVEIIEINVSNKKHRYFYLWQKRIFKILLRNSLLDLKFYRLPHNRTISLGTSYNL